MAKTVCIVGAGIVGRMLAIKLARRGWLVTVVDQQGRDGRGSCTWTGAGMLAPYCELESRHLLVSRLGLASMALWEAWAMSLAVPVPVHVDGSLIVAHGKDRQELQRIHRAVTERLPGEDVMRPVNAREIQDLEPELAVRFSDGLYVPTEGYLDNRQLLAAMAQTMDDLRITWHTETEAQAVDAQRVVVDGESWEFDWVCDCRGMGARDDVAGLRGVRGELLYVHAPEVTLSRPVRVLHPRYPIYVVPRDDHVYVIGATQIESDATGAITVRSVLELLSAAYVVHSGFAEAAVLESSVACRPAYADNLPQLTLAPGLLRLNGLYRHGFLVSPILTEAAVALLDGQPPPDVAGPCVKRS